MVNKRSTDLASYANLQGEFKRRFSLHNPGKSGFGDHGEIETLFLSRRETRDFPFFGREEENWPVPGQASSALEASTVLTKRLNLAAQCQRFTLILVELIVSVVVATRNPAP